MAGLGELVEPDLTVWTPPDVLAWLLTINTQVGALARDIAETTATIERHADGPRFMSDWRDFKAQWATYFNRWTTSATARATDPFGNESRTYVRMYNALESRYQTITGRRATRSSVALPGEEENPVRSVNYALMGWAVIGIVGIIGLGYLFSNYAKIKMVGRMAFNPRRKRRDRRR